MADEVETGVLNGETPDKEEFLTGLARGLSVLKAFSAKEPEMTISQVAAATRLSPATARRCLLTLWHLGYLRRNGTRFVLRATVLEFGAAFSESTGLSDAIQPILEELRSATGDSASFNVLEGDEILQVLHLPTRRLIREVFTAGGRLPAYLVPTGRVLLAHFDEAALEAYLASVQIEPRTSQTVKTVDEVRAKIDEAREKGYSVVVDEIEHGLIGIAVPVYDAERNAVAGLGTAMIGSGTVDLDELLALRLPELRRAAAQITRQLSRFPALAHSLRAA